MSKRTALLIPLAIILTVLLIFLVIGVVSADG